MSESLLDLTAGLPTRTLEPGDTLFVQGEPATSIAVLVDGALEIKAGALVVNQLTAPGSVVGEIGALLEQRRNATVTALAPSVIREIGDPEEMFAQQPQLGLEIARQLAGRLDRLTAYVVDVQRQFADRDDHLGVFGELLMRIASRPSVELDPGSDRSPDY